MLLTSGGITNNSIEKAFLNLVGKPAEDVKVAFIPTAALGEGDDKDWFINDLYRLRNAVGYVDIIDIAQLPKDDWEARIEPCDVIFVGGGNTFYLSYWMQKSGLSEALPELLKTRVYAGISAGSMIATKSLALASQAIEHPQALVDAEYDILGPIGRSSGLGLGFVDFLFRPHLNSRYFSMARKELIEQKAKEFKETIYALDDASAIVINGENLKVVSEGEWAKLEP
jgi:dipeptidase E